MQTQIVLLTTDHEVANKLIPPLADSISKIDVGPDDGSMITIRWGAADVRRGALENLFSVVGQIDVGAFGLGVLASLLANWIWARTTVLHPEPKPRPTPLKITIRHRGNDHQIDLSSLEALETSIRTALDVDESKN
jgi:hypothetical protein